MFSITSCIIHSWLLSDVKCLWNSKRISSLVTRFRGSHNNDFNISFTCYMQILWFKCVSSALNSMHFHSLLNTYIFIHYDTIFAFHTIIIIWKESRFKCVSSALHFRHFQSLLNTNVFIPYDTILSTTQQGYKTEKHFL